MSVDEQELCSDSEADAERPSLAASLHLLSISIDPQYDTPAVLRAYGREVSGVPNPFASWEFASGTPQQVENVAKFFGLKYWNESGQIVHSLTTILISPTGKEAASYRGNAWQPASVLTDLKNYPRN